MAINATSTTALPESDPGSGQRSPWGFEYVTIKEARWEAPKIWRFFQKKEPSSSRNKQIRVVSNTSGKEYTLVSPSFKKACLGWPIRKPFFKDRLKNQFVLAVDNQAKPTKEPTTEVSLKTKDGYIPADLKVQYAYTAFN